MLKLSSTVDISNLYQLHDNQPYTLHFNLEISKDNIIELLNRLKKSTPSVITDSQVSTHELESQISGVLHEIGIPAHIMGYRYLKDAILLSVTDRNSVNAITKILYPEIASLHHTTSSRVERAIRHAIEVAWARGNMEVLDRIFGYTVNPNSGRPTNSEFIALISDNLCIKNHYYEYSEQRFL